MATKKQPPKKRLPLPLKPPKVEPSPNAYTRKRKHSKKWTETENAADKTGGEP